MKSEISKGSEEQINTSINSSNAEVVNIEKPKKFTWSNYSLLVTHAINNVASVFVSTFLVSYIYTISNNYVYNIGLFYMINYLVMAIVYYLASMLIDRTNRVIIYKIALLIRGAFMLTVVLMGQSLAQYVVLAGALHGFSEAMYWSSYNIMKNELISNSLVKNYTTAQHSVEKLVNIIVPIALGSLIDVGSFKLSAIIVMCVVVVQIIFSFFIKSKRPENSSFSIKEFRQDIKNLGEKSKAIKLIFVATILYGILTSISILRTVLIMYSFNSNFSLGIFSSIFAIGSMLLVIILNRFVKTGKHKFLSILAGLLPIIIAVIMSIWTNQYTVIAFAAVYSIFETVHGYFYDVYRNSILKKFNLYHDIAEYQCIIEVIMEVVRTIAFGILAIAGIIGASFGVAGMVASIKIVLCISLIAIIVLNILLLVIEKLLIKYGVIEKDK